MFYYYKSRSPKSVHLMLRKYLKIEYHLSREVGLPVPPPIIARVLDAHPSMHHLNLLRSYHQNLCITLSVVYVTNSIKVHLGLPVPETLNPRAPPSRFGESVANSYHRSCAKNSNSLRICIQSDCTLWYFYRWFV